MIPTISSTSTQVPSASANLPSFTYGFVRGDGSVSVTLELVKYFQEDAEKEAKTISNTITVEVSLQKNLILP